MVELSGRPAEFAFPGADALNDRDLEALRQLAAGRSIAEVAAAMSVSRNTVRTRLRRIQGKLSTPRRDDAVRLAGDFGLP